MQLAEWITAYTAIVNTVALGIAALIYTAWVRHKDAEISSLKAQLDHWKSQSVEAVHRANEALRKEIAELRNTADIERERLEREKTELITAIENLRKAEETPSESIVSHLTARLTDNYDRLIVSPPSGLAAETLAKAAWRLKSPSPQEYHLFLLSEDSPSRPPVGFRSFEWGSSPWSGLKKVAGPTDGVVMYVPMEGSSLPPLFDLPVAEEAYSFSNGKFYSGSSWLDGPENFQKLKTALTRTFGQPAFANAYLSLWKWKWPGSGVEVHLSYQAKVSRTNVTFANNDI
ncbi:MAG: hypothetical protein L0338_21580 [Acidobacteria bacterium]|nr:hypothetical protein [Acidobacteriota bacterium]